MVADHIIFRFLRSATTLAMDMSNSLVVVAHMAATT